MVRVSGIFRRTTKKNMVTVLNLHVVWPFGGGILLVKSEMEVSLYVCVRFACLSHWQSAIGQGQWVTFMSFFFSLPVQLVESLGKGVFQIS